MQKTAILFLSACIYANSAFGQLLKYDNEQELMGAAVSSPYSAGQIVKRLVDKCGAYNDSLRTSGDRALHSWEAHHQAYLEEGLRVKAQLEAKLSTPTDRSAFKNMLEKQLPEAIQKQYEALAVVIDSAPSQAGKVRMCEGYVQAIADGKFDLKVNDPTLSAYFDKRIRARSDKK